MKDILFAGNVSYVTDSMLEQIEGQGRPVVCGTVTDKKYKNKRVVTYPYREDSHEYQGIFKSYEIETVVYFSTSIDGQKRLYDEMDHLENTLYCANLSRVKQFIYVTTNDYMAHPNKIRSHMLLSCEQLCEQMGKENGMSVVVIRVPYVFSPEIGESYLYKTIQKALKDKILDLNGSEDRETAFISDVDLGELIARNINEPADELVVSNIAGGETITFGELGEKIQGLIPDLKVAYRGYVEAIPASKSDRVMNERYGWFGTQKVSDWLEEIIHTIENEKIEKKRFKFLNIRLGKARKFVIMAIEMIALFALAEFLTNITSDNATVDYVDFRLLFVVIMAMVHGTGAGTVAALLACIGYFSKGVSENGLQLVFFNIENWLPFGAYFLCGTIVGHVCDKYKETIRFTNEQQEILENKYVFLNELYGKTIENKDNYSRQIVGYQDSLGKLYSVVKELNWASNDEVMFKSVSAIEEIMTNTSAAIYYVSENSDYARLAICSREIKPELVKSLRVNNLPNVNRSIMRHQSWYNTVASIDEPAYVSPILRDGKTVAMIALWKADSTQMKMDYFNRFNIMCGLIQEAVIRAMEYAEYNEATQMYGDTKILKRECFEEKLSIQRKLDSDGMSDYILMKIIAPGKTLKEVGVYMDSVLRATDMVGLYENNEPYAILGQTTMAGIEAINARLEKVNICLVGDK